MKKALAIILALVMCLSVGMMAFAAEDGKSNVEADAVVSTSATDLTSAGDASTNVDIYVNYNNISVTVPLRYAIVAKVDGGDCWTPKDGTYYIQNNSAIPVNVTDAEVVYGADNGEWKLVSTISSAAPAAGEKNEIAMTLTPDEGVVWDLAVDYPTGWSLDASTDSTSNGKLDIAIDATSSMLNTTDDEIDAFIITYTFAAA